MNDPYPKMQCGSKPSLWIFSNNFSLSVYEWVYTCLEWLVHSLLIPKILDITITSSEKLVSACHNQSSIETNNYICTVNQRERENLSKTNLFWCLWRYIPPYKVVFKYFSWSCQFWGLKGRCYLLPLLSVNIFQYHYSPISSPANIYHRKSWRRSGVFTVNFEHDSLLFVVFLFWAGKYLPSVITMSTAFVIQKTT